MKHAAIENPNKGIGNPVVSGGIVCHELFRRLNSTRNLFLRSRPCSNPFLDKGAEDSPEKESGEECGEQSDIFVLHPWRLPDGGEHSDSDRDVGTTTRMYAGHTSDNFGSQFFSLFNGVDDLVLGGVISSDGHQSKGCKKQCGGNELDNDVPEGGPGDVWLGKKSDKFATEEESE